MSTEIAIRPSDVMATARTPAPPTPAEWDMIKSMAGTMSMSAIATYFKASASPREDAMMAMLVAHGLELHPSVVIMGGITIIPTKNGPRVDIAGGLMLGLAQARMPGFGYRLIEQSAEQFVIEAWSDSKEPERVVFSMEMAKRAGLAEKDTYRSYGPDMLFSKCARRVVRRLAPGVLYGLGAPVVDDEDDDEPEAPPALTNGAGAATAAVTRPAAAEAPTPAPPLSPVKELSEFLKLCGWPSATAVRGAVNAKLKELGRRTVSSASLLGEAEARELLELFRADYDEQGKPREKVVAAPSGGDAVPGGPSEADRGPSEANEVVGATEPAEMAAGQAAEPAPEAPPPVVVATGSAATQGSLHPPEWEAALQGDPGALVLCCSRVQKNYKGKLLHKADGSPTVWMVDSQIIEALGMESAVPIFGHPRSAGVGVIMGIARELLKLKQALDLPNYAKPGNLL